ncbi:hypothetical protein P4S64_09285 [Vibrio sp. M60_M31a]
MTRRVLPPLLPTGTTTAALTTRSGKDVDSVMNEMASRGFDIMLTRIS